MDLAVLYAHRINSDQISWLKTSITKYEPHCMINLLFTYFKYANGWLKVQMGHMHDHYKCIVVGILQIGHMTTTNTSCEHDPK